MVKETFFFCVDAGATGSRGRLYDVSGAARAYATSGPANASYDTAQALASVADLWEKLSGMAGHDPRDVGAALFSIGGAGLYNPVAQAAFVASLPGYRSVLTMSDGYAAMIGAGGGRPCAMLTIGTGVAGHRLFADGTSIQRDALGWIAGDRGGGCWLGTRALRHALEVWDGVAAPSALSAAVLAEIGGTEGIVGGDLAGLNATRLAAFAPLLLAAADGGCPVSAAILARGVDHLARLVEVLDCGAVPLYLNGGLAEVLKPMLAARIARPLAAPAGGPLAGCLLVAQGRAPQEQAVFA